MSAPIASARVRENLNHGNDSCGTFMVIRDEAAMLRIAAALDLLERVEAGDAGLVEVMSLGMVEKDYFAFPTKDEAEPFARAALAALVGRS